MTSLASIAQFTRQNLLAISGGMALLVGIAAPLAAQPAQGGGIDSDLVRPGGDNRLPGNAPAPNAETAPPASYNAAPPPYADQPYTRSQYAPAPYADAQPMATGPANSPCGRTSAPGGVYQSDDLIGAAEGVFGTGARGLAALIRDILHKQGAPDGYIAGREAGGAFVVGLRYGSGVLCQKVEGPRPLPVYWTGPSFGFDAGAEGGRTFVLVYNLNNHDDLFKRFGAGEGQAYLIGGFNVSYLRSGDVVLIPVRMGVGLRLGINGGYMKFSRHQNWVPF